MYTVRIKDHAQARYKDIQRVNNMNMSHIFKVHAQTTHLL